MANAKPECFVALNGVLCESADSRWAIGAPLAHAEDVIQFVNECGMTPVVYGPQCETRTGVLSIQRWLRANLLDADVSYFSDRASLPPGAEVIDRWPLTTDQTKSSSTNSSPADQPQHEQLATTSETA